MAARADALAQWGLQPDDKVRWRPTGRRSWTEARVTRLEADGSVGCVDADGRARALRPERLQVWRRTAKGTRRWEALCGPQQLALFADASTSRRPRRAGAGAAPVSRSRQPRPTPR